MKLLCCFIFLVIFSPHSLFVFIHLFLSYSTCREGFNREGSVEARGIIPRAIEQIFGHIQRYASPRMRFLVRASYLQIYNEAISDLLKPERSNLTIREDKKRGVYVDGLSEWVVRSPAEIYGLMERGGAVRATGETKVNDNRNNYFN